MSSEDEKFKIEGLDHVAIRVKDLDTSANWYHEVLGLKRYLLPEWGSYPIMMLANRSGVALFPENPKTPDADKSQVVDHFAFNVTNEDFQNAITRYDQLKLSYTIQDHVYFRSIYTKDPDGHTVELTTLVVDPDTFYRQD